MGGLAYTFKNVTPRQERPVNNPLVTIATCTRNRADLLRETLSSILVQQYDPVEIIVVDDGSTDGTKKTIADYKDKIVYHSQENSGFARALNTACRLARGEYIAINDDDDLMPPDRISRLYEALCRFPRAVLAVGEAEMIDSAGNRTGKLSTYALKGNSDAPILIENGYGAILWPLITPATCATLFRRADGERIGWIDERFRRSADTDFFSRLALLGPIVYVPQVVAYYRRRHTYMWSDNIANNLLCEYNNLVLFEKHLKSVHAGQKEITERLQARMLHTLKRLAFLIRHAEDVPWEIERDFIRQKKGLPLLGLKKRLSYEWYARMRLPLASVIKGLMKTAAQR